MLCCVICNDKDSRNQATVNSSPFTQCSKTEEKSYLVAGLQHAEIGNMVISCHRW